MDCELFTAYSLSVDSIAAEEDFRAIQVACFPNMKQGKQKKVEKELRSKLERNVQSVNTAPPKSTEQLYHHLLRTLGNG